MGFLDHSTNNIILDAVLTDKGREFLSRNDGSFSIDKFALGDDEVNYTIIKKYGRTVGKEKIEKNTPIFESLTDQTQSQKYKLVSNSNPNLVKMPTYDITGDFAYSGGIVTVYVQQQQGSPTQSKITLTQKVLNQISVDQEFQDQSYMVDLPHLFLKLPTTDSLKSVDKMQRAMYVLTASPAGTVQITVISKSVTSSQFDVYGSGLGKGTIKTYVRVTGMNSGTVTDIPVHIKRSTV